MDAEAFRSALGAVASVASADGNRVAFVPSGEGLTLYAESVDVGTAQAELPTRVSGNGESWPLGLNAQYLADALPEKGRVRLSWESTLEPVVIAAPGAPLTVLMPMKLDGALTEAVVRLKGKGRAVARAEVSPEPEPEPEVAPVEVTEAEPEPEPTCAYCGARPVEAEARFCTECGAGGTGAVRAVRGQGRTLYRGRQDSPLPLVPKHGFPFARTD